MSRDSFICKFLRNFDFAIAGVALTVLILVTFFGVIMRRFFGSPFVWQEEVQLFCMVWIVYFGGSAAFRTESHVAIDVLVDRFPMKVQRVINILIYLVVVVILGYAISQFVVFLEQLVNTNRQTNLLHIPYVIIYSALPVGFVLMIINYTFMTFKHDLLAEDTEMEEETCQ